MKLELKINFGKSSSPNYKKAIFLSKKFNTFSPASEKNPLNAINVNSISELQEKKYILESLWEIVKFWKTSEFIFNNEHIDFKEIREIFMILECSKSYSKSVFPEKYCKTWGEKEGWGCKFLTAVERHHEKYSHYYEREIFWYKFGHFLSSNVWKIDKTKLKKAILREVELKKIYFCNKFDIKKVINIIKSLPGRINLKKSDTWSIVFEESIAGTIKEKKPISIKHEGIKEGYRENRGLSYQISVSLPHNKENIEKEKEKIEQKRNIPNVTFLDIGGIDDIIEIIREVIELPLIKPDLIDHLGIKPHRGILLYGPPGCGKTMIAKAIANEIKAHFIPINGPELLSKWYGETEENLRNIFEEARKLQPSVIYWDEIDSLAQKRSGMETVRLESRIVNQLLTLMDGIEDYGNICIIASTNRKELLDEALLRPGRFDYSIEIEKPTKEGCYKIFSIAIKDMPVDKKFDVRSFYKSLIGLSGAEITFVAREGAYNCLRRNVNLKKVIKKHEFGDIDYKNLIIKEEDFHLALKKILEYGKDNIKSS
jgi:ATP-dependent 26S proteasome regulatory subunit